MTHNPTGRSGRVALYEWLRLIATLMVVLGHSTYLRISTQYGYLDRVEALQWLAPVYYSFFFDRVRAAAMLVYTFHMPLFFFLSGAVLHLRPIGPLGPFVRKKARRLILPYYLCGLLFMLPVKIFTDFYTPEKLPKGIVGFLLGGTDGGHLWFLTALFWCMVVFALLEKASVRAVGHRPAVQLVVLLGASGVLQLLAGQLPFELLGFVQGMRYLFWFALGYAFEPLRGRFAQLSAGRTAGLLAAVTVLWAAGSRAGLLQGGLTVLAGGSWTLLLAQLCSKLLAPVESTRLYRVLAASLFGIYLYHDPLEHLILWGMVQMQWASTNAGCWLYLLARTLGVVVVSVLLDRGLRQLSARIKKANE